MKRKAKLLIWLSSASKFFGINVKENFHLTCMTSKIRRILVIKNLYLRENEIAFSILNAYPSRSPPQLFAAPN